MAVSDSRAMMFRTVMLPALVGIPAGIIADILTGVFLISGYLGPEYYAGPAVELMVVVLLGGIVSLPSAFRFCAASDRPFGEMAAGIGAFTLFSLLLAAFYGFLPVILIIVMIWLWTSMRWQHLELPPFRLGLWMCMGAVCGAMAGAIAHSLIIQ